MAFVPDEAILRQYSELTPAASALYNFYCKKRGKKTGGWNCTVQTVLAELKGFTEPTYFRARRELLEKKWIAANKNYIAPLVGFEDVNRGLFGAENPIKNDRNEREETIKIDSSDDAETIKTDSPTIKIDSETIKNDSPTIKNDSSYNKEIPAPLTSPSNQPIIPAQNGGGSAEEDSPSVETSKEKKSRGKKSTSEVKKWSAEVQEVFEAWQVATKQPKTILTDDRRDRIIARLEQGFTVERLLLCLEGWKVSPWHQGDNPYKKIYNKVETIFRDASQVDGFIANVEQKPKANPQPKTFGNDDDIFSPNYVAPAKPVTFAEVLELTFDAYRVEGDPQEIFERTKNNYLKTHKGPEFEAEVAAYEQSDAFRQRIGEARSQSAC